MKTDSRDWTLDLSGRWDLRDDRGDHALEISFPDDIISALHRAERIPDPYWGRNEYGLRWIAERDWIARRSFDLPTGDVRLRLSGLDTVAEVRVNGSVVLEAANAFRRFDVDLSGVAQPGSNMIEIRFASNVAEAARRQEAQPFFVPYHAENCPIPNGNMLRKPQCDFGWDWNIALAPCGLYGAIEIVPNGVTRLRDMSVTQHHGTDGVTVNVRLIADRAPDRDEICIVDFAGQEERVALRAGQAQAEVAFHVSEPELWWPAGLGAQTLYPLTARIGDHALTRRIGLRSVELITDPDPSGARFGLRVNGREVFARGANWIPADALPGRVTEDKTRDLLQSAVDANMNILRVWGGGRYEPDWFYDLCDEMGLMVWQDFMFACNLYPSTADYLAEVRAEVADVVARIGHHACIALWCGDNELIGALTWFEESRKDRDRYLVSYDRLNRAIETTLKELLPSANWWPSSPSPGTLDFGDAWHNDGSGDMHFWSVWHEGRDFEHYRDISPRFCSEFGFQSYPSMDVIRSFAGSEDFNIAAPVLESHQKNAGGNARIAETMFRYFRFPFTFEDFVYLSQVQQGLAIQTAVDYWRSLKPHCIGAIYWQLNDTWPVASWSSLDYGGGWKLLHHMARRFFDPVRVLAVPTERGIALKAVNDTADVVDIDMTVRAASVDGSVRHLSTATGSVPTERSAVLATIADGTLRDDEILVFDWTVPGRPTARDHFAPKRYKAYRLQPPRIRTRVKRVEGMWQVTLESAALALFVALEPSVPGRLSDNAVTLLPGQPVRLFFTPQSAGDAVTFTVRDLHSATFTTPA